MRAASILLENNLIGHSQKLLTELLAPYGRMFANRPEAAKFLLRSFTKKFRMILHTLSKSNLIKFQQTIN